MIEETGRVVATEGAFAWVETQRQSACGHCSVQDGCGTSVLSKVVGRKLNRVRALNPSSARVGDEVIVGLDESAMLRGSFMVYTLPLLLMLAGAVLAQAVAGGGEAVSILGGALGLGAGFWMMRRHALRSRQDRRYQPVILRQAVYPVGLHPRTTTPMKIEE